MQTWTNDGIHWYPTEGGLRSYTTNESEIEGVVYNPIIKADPLEIQAPDVCSCGHPNSLHIKTCTNEGCQCGK